MDVVKPFLEATLGHVAEAPATRDGAELADGIPAVPA
jgi:hypothetical protein